MEKFIAVLSIMLVLSTGSVSILAQQNTNEPSKNELTEKLEMVNAFAKK